MKNIFIKEKMCKTPTLRGWLVMVASTFLVGFCVIVNLNSFLSLNDPIDAKVMVIEGWLPNYALATAAEEFREKHYSLLFSTGIMIDKGDLYWDEKTYAEMGAKAMRRLGIDSNSVVAVPSSDIKVDRTFASACALRHWIDGSGRQISKVNVVTLGVHGRRSGILFRKALGEKIDVGIISYPDQTYDARRWWSTSNGFKTTVDEIVSYCYTKLVFWIKKRDSI